MTQHNLKNYLLCSLSLLISSALYGQSSTSIYDYVLNDYLFSRIQTKSFYLKKQLISNKDVYSLLTINNKETTLKNDPFTSDLISALNSQKCRSNKLHPKSLRYKSIRENFFERRFDIIKIEEGITFKDPVSNWLSFIKKFPDCKAIVSLSCPIISKDSSKFLIFIDYYEATKSGFGDLIFFVKDGSDWKVKKEINLTKPLLEKIVIGD